MELKELQKIELDILKYIDVFCKKYNITYFLGAGTLIGAVRHKGFIPWDDDIDIFMKREDYMRFIDCWEADKDERYKVLSLYNSNDYYYPFIKVVDSHYKVIEANGRLKEQKDLGVWVDIFPLDYYDRKINSFKELYLAKQKFHCTVGNRLYFGIKSKKNIILKFIKTVAYFIYHKKNPHEYALRLDKLAQKCKVKTDKLFSGTTELNEKGVFNAEWFEKSILLPFEDGEFYGPIGYDDVLKKQYGDYMTLPPVEERQAKHEIMIEERI